MCGQLEDNIGKNRVPSILPLDLHRAYLSTPVKGSNDYINAVFLPVSTPSIAWLVKPLSQVRGNKSYSRQLKMVQVAPLLGAGH